MHSDPLLMGNPPLTRINLTHTHTQADRSKHTQNPFRILQLSCLTFQVTPQWSWVETSRLCCDL